MTIYFCHSGSFNYKDELYTPIKSAKFYSQHTVILPHDFSQAPNNSLEKTAGYDLIIAEVSFPSTGMGIELGWANSLNKRIVCIYKEGVKYSSSLETITREFYPYSNADLVKILDKIILETV